MDVAALVRARVLQITGVTTLVGQRVYTGPRWPQSVTVPAVRVHQMSPQESSQLKGSSGMIKARVQVDSLATTRAAAIALDALIDGDGAGSGLNHWSGTIGSVQVKVIEPADMNEGFEPDEIQQYKVMRDYFVSVAR